MNVDVGKWNEAYSDNKIKILSDCADISNTDDVVSLKK